MKKITSILAALVLAVGFAAPLVHADTASFTKPRWCDGIATTNSFNCQFPRLVAGDTLVATVGISNPAAHLNTITGGGATWVKAAQTSVNRDLEVWYGTITDASSTNVAITTNMNGVTATYHVVEWTGIKASSPVDAIGYTSGKAAVMSSGAISTGENNELIIGAERNATNPTFVSDATNGFTRTWVGDQHIFNVAYKIGDMGVYTTSWTQGSALPYDGLIVSFRHQ